MLRKLQDRGALKGGFQILPTSAGGRRKRWAENGGARLFAVLGHGLRRYQSFALKRQCEGMEFAVQTFEVCGREREWIDSAIVALPAELKVRNYERRDREAIRHLCCETGYLGNPIDPVFEDRELFADYLTAYYTDWEPEASFVLEQDGVVKGYLLGSRRPLRQQFYGLFQNLSLFMRGMLRYRSYRQETREFIHWILKNSWKEVPAAPRRTAHFHINLLPEAKGLAGSNGMLNAYCDFLRAHGEKAVFGQMVTFESRRGAKLFERFGFQVLEKREITKYRGKYPEPVYLTTVIKYLSDPKGDALAEI